MSKNKLINELIDKANKSLHIKMGGNCDNMEQAIDIEKVVQVANQGNIDDIKVIRTKDNKNNK